MEKQRKRDVFCDHRSCLQGEMQICLVMEATQEGFVI